MPIAAASVGAESLFSDGKEVMTDRRARLKPDVFEAIQCLKRHWRNSIKDLAAENMDLLEVGAMMSVEEFEEFEERELQLVEMEKVEHEDGMDV